MATRLGSADDQGKSFFAKSPIAAFNGALRHPAAAAVRVTILRARYADVVTTCASPAAHAGNSAHHVEVAGKDAVDATAAPPRA